ncbi:MAG: hypothetical protein BWY42_00446 [Candidatus Omnitrophica bacterium ADurb.Bin277]|nr:MAG: hypothetical protein BWY42_00446 [Candidatus Omnitrophica bacterium ADurb.Bin277]
MNELKNFWEVVLTQRTWSWAFPGILNLILFLAVRSLYFHPVIKQAKLLNSKWYHEIKKAYTSRSAAGWILFIVSLLLVVFAWQTANLKEFSLYEAGLAGLILLALFLAAMSHIAALGGAVIHVMKRLENNQMTL